MLKAILTQIRFKNKILCKRRRLKGYAAEVNASLAESTYIDPGITRPSQLKLWSENMQGGCHRNITFLGRCCQGYFSRWVTLAKATANA